MNFWWRINQEVPPYQASPATQDRYEAVLKM